jgi:hypothetical protein
MIDLSAISVALSSLGVADEMVETIIGLTDCADLQSKLKEARSKLIDASDAVFAARDERVQLLERIHQLENELADYKAKYGIIPVLWRKRHKAGQLALGEIPRPPIGPLGRDSVGIQFGSKQPDRGVNVRKVRPMACQLAL